MFYKNTLARYNKSQKTWGSYGLGAAYSGKAKAGLSIIWGNSAIWAKLTTNKAQ